MKFRALLALLFGVTAYRWYHSPRKAKKLYVSMGRVNREARDQLMPDPEATEYMEKVKERIMLGDKCQRPPLFGGARKGEEGK